MLPPSAPKRPEVPVVVRKTSRPKVSLSLLLFLCRAKRLTRPVSQGRCRCKCASRCPCRRSYRRSSWITPRRRIRRLVHYEAVNNAALCHGWQLSQQRETASHPRVPISVNYISITRSTKSGYTSHQLSLLDRTDQPPNPLKISRATLAINWRREH